MGIRGTSKTISFATESLFRMEQCQGKSLNLFPDYGLTFSLCQLHRRGGLSHKPDLFLTVVRPYGRLSSAPWPSEFDADDPG